MDYVYEIVKRFCKVKAKQCFPFSKRLTTNRNKNIKQ